MNLTVSQPRILQQWNHGGPDALGLCSVAIAIALEWPFLVATLQRHF